MLGRTILMTYKHKTHAVDSDGKITSNADLDFYIDDVSLLTSFSWIFLFSYFKCYLGMLTDFPGHIGMNVFFS